MTMPRPIEPLILPYAGTQPQLASPPVYAGPGAAVLGRATLGKNVWLGARCVIRADGNIVQAGDDLHLGARSTLHIAHGRFACIIGARVVIGENACVHACTVGDDVIIGDDVVILDGAVVANQTVFEPGASVFPGKQIEGGHVYAGSPAKAVRPITIQEIAERRQRILQQRAMTATTRPASQIAAGSALDASVFVASTATLHGVIEAAAFSSVWFGNDFDAGSSHIRIGESTNVQDNTVIRCTSAQGVTIGRETTVGHNVTIADCTIGDHCLVGIGSVIAPGTHIQDHVFLAASARTQPGQVLESGFFYAGAPAAKRGPLDQQKRDTITRTVRQYRLYAQDFKSAEERFSA